MPAANERQQEPSMEEILASIRRIISEDGEDGDAKAAPKAEADNVLELTEVVAEGGEVVSLAEQAEKARKVEKAEPAPAKPAAAKAAEPETPDVAEPAAEEPQAAASGVKPGLMSEAREAAAAAAMGGLLDAVKDEPISAGGKTIEDITRELLRPMLHAWLDENLPVLVERLVKDEIERVVGRARGR